VQKFKKASKSEELLTKGRSPIIIKKRAPLFQQQR